MQSRLGLFLAATKYRPLVVVMALTCSSAFAQIPEQVGWHSLPNTRIQSVCAGENGFPQVLGASGCMAITEAWSSAAYDSKRDRLIVWGGGHDDYYGNELYAVNLQSSTVVRLTDPGLPVASQCTESIANGTQPNSRHTYDGIEYIEVSDELFVFGGSLACPIGDFGNDTWVFDFDTAQWERRNPSGPTPQGDAGMLTAYDPVTGLIYLHDRIHLYSYDTRTNSYQRLTSSQAGLSYLLAATIDPDRRLFLIMGEGRIHAYSIADGSSYSRSTISTSGGGAIINADYPGLAFDSNARKIVGWSKADVDSIYTLDLDNNSWTRRSYSGGPVAARNGTYGRFRYSGTSGVFVLANRVSDNVYVLRTNPGNVIRPSSPTSFKAQ